MAFRINEFKEALAGGGARPNQFRVRLSAPNGDGDGLQLDENLGLQSAFLVQAAQLPSSNIGTTPVFFRGRQIPFAGDRTFEPWTVTVLNDRDFKIRQILEEWVALMGNNARVEGATEPVNYQADLFVDQLDRDGDTVIRTYKFHDAFPSDVDAIDLSMSDNDTIEQYGVTWQFSYWTIVSEGTRTGGTS
jgi:hypothetical protein